MATRTAARIAASLTLIGLAWLAAMLPAAAIAEHLPHPEGRVILTVDGLIAHTNASGTARMDRAMLESLGLTTLETHTPWTDGPHTFSGIPFERLLEYLGATGGTAVARALNDYVVPIPVGDIRRKQAFLALGMDGQPLTVRDKGPIWVVFPWDQDPTLDDKETKHQAIWQLTKLTFE